MKAIKKYTAIKLGTERTRDTVNLSLEYPDVIEFYYGDELFHNTEEEAIEYAFNKGRWENWLIVPVISFDNYED